MRDSDIFDFIAKCFDSESIKFSTADGFESDWNTVCSQAPCALVDYAYGNVIYQAEYFRERSLEFVNASAVIFYEDYPIAVIPLFITRETEKSSYLFNTNGLPLLAPLISKKYYATKVHRHLNTSYLNMVCALGTRLGVGSVSFREISLEYSSFSEFHCQLMDVGATPMHLEHMLFVDLAMPYERIWTCFRKQYRAFINKAQKVMKYRIIDRYSNDEDIDIAFEEFRLLHHSVSGRVTRGKDTWDIQRGILKKSDDYVVLINYPDDVLIGASLFSTSSSCVQYAVGAYNRELFKTLPIGHLSQSVAIKRAQELGKRWYFVGKRYYPQDSPRPTEKEVSISYFKRGFATDVFPQYIMELDTSAFARVPDGGN